MKSKEDLYVLVQAMSRSEKRYFTINAKKSGQGDTKYLELFKVLSQMPAYDEKALKDRFSTSTLHADKSYLYDAILSSMRDYRSTRSKYTEIKEFILDYQYLLEQGLLEQAEARLQAARRRAEALGDTLSLLEINREERRLAWELKQQNRQEVFEGLQEQAQTHQAFLNEEFRYHNLYYELLQEVTRLFMYKTPEQKEALRKRIPDFVPEQAPTSLLAGLRYWQCGFYYYQLLSARADMWRCGESILAWWDGNPLYKQEEFYRYVIDMSNILHALINLGEKENMLLLLKKLEAESPVLLPDKEVLFRTISIYRLLYYLNYGPLKEGEKVATDIEFGLQNYRIPDRTRLVLVFNVGILFFMLEEYATCGLWCEKIIKDRHPVSLRLHIQSAIRLLWLAACMEVDSDDFSFDNTWRSCQRYFSHLPETSFEKQWLLWAKKWYESPLQDQKMIKKEFLAFLEAENQQPESARFMGVDVLWITKLKEG